MNTRRLRRCTWVAIDAALLVLLGLVVFIGYGALPNGWYRTVVVTGGSMQPALTPGDLIIVTPPPKTVETGMMVVLSVGDRLITHRVTEVRGDGTFLTKGDANTVADDFSGEAVSVYGVVAWRVPVPGIGALFPIRASSSAAFHDRWTAEQRYSIGRWAEPAQAQHITFLPIDGRPVTGPPFDLAATATSGLPVEFTATGDCTVSGGTVTITRAGSCTITASQAGSDQWLPAPDVSRTFEITRLVPDFWFDLSVLSPQTVGEAPFSVASLVSTNSAGDVTFALGAGSIGCSVTPAGVVTLIGPATGDDACVIEATLASTPTYRSADPIGQSFHILARERQAQGITFAPIDGRTVTDPPFDLSATATSGLPVTYAATGDCTASGGTVSITRAGSCTITASQAGNAQWLPAPDVSQTFDITKLDPGLTFDELSDQTTDHPPFSVADRARATSPGAITFALGEGSVGCSVSDAGEVTITGAATGLDACVIRATVDATDRYRGDTASRRFHVLVPERRSQDITFAPLLDRDSGDPPFDLDATASSELPVGYGAAGPCTVAGRTVTLTGTGECTITATQDGNDSWKPAEPVARTFRIGRAGQTIDFPAISARTYGDRPVAPGASASSGLPVSYAANGPCRIAGESVTLTGAGDCTITATQDGNGSWKPAEPAARTFRIDRAPLEVRARDKTRVLGAANPPLTVSYAGFVGDDGPADLSGTLACATTATESSPVGIYPITCSGLASPDYAVHDMPGALTITFAAAGACVDGPGHRILQPVDADGSSVFKQTSTVPVKFRVCEANGASVGLPGVVTRFRLVATRSGTVVDHVDEEVVSTTPDTEFRWSADDQLWIFNLNTRPLAKKKTYFYQITLADGTSIEFQFGLR